jgi:uncharacterized membrane protein
MTVRVPKARLEAFSDGVFAIIITIMVLELQAPAGPGLDSLRPLLPAFLRYMLSFIFIGIYWNNHHHLLHGAHHINAGIMWANLHLLFWMSLIPFVTGWLGEHYREPWPTAMYGVVLLMAGCAYRILEECIIASEGRNSALAKALGRDWKGTLSLAAYVVAIVFAFSHQLVSDMLYVLVALAWLVPDSRPVSS